MPNTHKDDVAYIRELAKILKETDLTEVEVGDGEKHFRVKRELTVAAAPMVHAVAAPSIAPAAAPVAAPAAANAAAPTDAMTSPMVGTAYLSPKPGDPPFVKVGDSVKEGQTVLIIEAMKVMNPIKAAKSGKVTDIIVKDAQPVEFGQALLVIA
jgi:acetyl-CoA carboxylase biotin carboxyl carrier protein